MNFSRLVIPATFLILSLPLECTNSSRAEQRFPTRSDAPAAVLRSASDPTLTGAGDIASCESSGDERTASLLDDIPGPIFTVGDNAYRSEDVEKPFTECYEKSWGRHRARTHPVPGNHEHEDSDIDPYFDYFGRAAGERGKGYYSYRLGAWNIIALNSMLDASPDSPQGQWLADDLAKHQTRCTLAYFHHSRFSSGPHGRRQTCH